MSYLNVASAETKLPCQRATVHECFAKECEGEIKVRSYSPVGFYDSRNKNKYTLFENNIALCTLHHRRWMAQMEKWLDEI